MYLKIDGSNFKLATLIESYVCFLILSKSRKLNCVKTQNIMFPKKKIIRVRRGKIPPVVARGANTSRADKNATLEA